MKFLISKIKNKIKFYKLERKILKKLESELK